MEAIHEIPMILVTGFKPFLGEKINPTEKLIDELVRRQKIDQDFLHIHSLVLPVSFMDAPRLLQQKIDELNPDRVLMLGQAGGATKIRLERIALNWQETTSADENGYSPPVSSIDIQGREAYFTDINLALIKSNLESKQIPVEISLSAGAFVCNKLYYDYFKNNRARPGLFVHFPFLKEQVMGNKDTDFLDWETQWSAFMEILKYVSSY